MLSQLADPAGLAASSADDDVFAAAAQALSQPGSVILAGERLAEVPGALAAAAALAELTGARLAWIPRRAGERGAIEAGALPILLPGGRHVTDATARAEVAQGMGHGHAARPSRAGTPRAFWRRWPTASLRALVVAGVDPADLPDPEAALAAIEQAEFVVSLELRASPVTDRADVIFPVAAVAEKPGTFVNWEGRPGDFAAAIPVPGVRGDLHVLREIADAMDVHLGLPDEAAARRELAALGVARPRPPAACRRTAGRRRRAAPQGRAEALLATWHNLLDVGRMQDGEPNLAGTARPAVARMSAATAAEAGVTAGAKVNVATSRGSVSVPVEIAAMPDRVVWLPTNSAGCSVRRDLAAGHGSLVRMRSAE